MEINWNKSGYEFIQTDDATIKYRSIEPVNKDNTRETLPPGVYSVTIDMFGRFVFHKSEVSTDKLQSFATGPTKHILEEIQIFCKSKAKYERINQSYKRAFLLYGPPGTGKSSIAALAVKSLVEEYQAVILQIRSGDEIEEFSSAIENIRTNNPDQLVVALLEDAERTLQNYAFLSILDGHDTIENLILLATINDVNCLPDRIKNRPGRLNSRHLIDKLDVNVKRAYIENFIKDLSFNESFTDDFILKTNDLSFDEIKEVLVRVTIFNDSIENAIKEVTLVL